MLKVNEWVNALWMEDAQGSVRHAVDVPLGVTVLVADGDGEAAVIGAHQVDDLVAVVARQRQRRPFARVRRPVLALFTCCHKIEEKKIFSSFACHFNILQFFFEKYSKNLKLKKLFRLEISSGKISKNVDNSC